MMKEEVERELTGHILPFWKKLEDLEYGGFYGYMDFDLQLDRKAEKGCILNSRILWFFSTCCLQMRDPECLAMADHAYRFLTEHCLDKEEGGIFWSVTYDGQPLDTTKHTYNQAFAIYALSAYYQATGKEEARELALDLFKLIESRMRDEGGYLEAFDRAFQPSCNEKLSENGVLAERTMNTILHVLEAYTGLLQATGDGTVRQKLSEALQIVLDHIYLPEDKHLGVFFDSSYHSLIDLYSYGHDIEATWLLDLAAETVDDAALTKRIYSLTDTLVEQFYQRGFDGHSSPMECENGVVKEDRVWWVEAETVNGFLNAYRRHPEKKEYLKAAENTWDYIKTKVIDPRPGSEWYWSVNPDGTPERKPIVEPWKCPYHNGRMCLRTMAYDNIR